jgi:hypothetical protein
MSTIEELRASMRAANVAGTGQYILLGKHLLEVQKLFYKRSVIDGAAQESIIAEFTVLQTSNSESRVGETRSTVFKFDKKGALSRLKPMLIALLGVDPYAGRITPDAEDAAIDVYVALRDETERRKKNLSENFMMGRKVWAEGFPGTIKTGPNAGKPIVQINWTPFTETAE